MSATTTISFDLPGQRQRPGLVVGIAISVALHALLMFGYRLSSPPTQEAPARSMIVWLQAPKPPASVVQAEPAPRKRERVAVATARPRAAVPAAQAPSTPEEAPAITPAPAPDPLYADQQPKPFNMEEAKKIARKVTKEKDPARAGTLAAQLEEHPLYPEQSTTELAQKLEGARRPSCLKGSGGLFAPLIWLMDKKDSGCKF